jgi:hypothetical protein
MTRAIADLDEAIRLSGLRRAIALTFDLHDPQLTEVRHNRERALGRHRH